MSLLQDLQRIAREYTSARDRHRSIAGAVSWAKVEVLARQTADAAVKYLDDRRRRRKKENRRQGVGPDDVKRLKIAQGRPP